MIWHIDLGQSSKGSGGSAEELHKMGVLDDQAAKFMRSPHAKFFPFSSTDPDDKIIFRLKWTGEFEAILRKADVTN